VSDANALAAYAHAQKLAATFDEQWLALAWTGANWEGDGDLFVYLDTQAGGALTAYNPYTDTLRGALVVLPPLDSGQWLRADLLVWVQDADTASLLRWDEATSQWLTANVTWHYFFDPNQPSPETQIYLPRAELAIPVDGWSLVALASEEKALRLWAAIPSNNPLNSPLAARCKRAMCATCCCR
jgi:hypothetical protein